jgi:hypothetical protein
MVVVRWQMPSFTIAIIDGSSAFLLPFPGICARWRYFKVNELRDYRCIALSRDFFNRTLKILLIAIFSSLELIIDQGTVDLISKLAF